MKYVNHRVISVAGICASLGLALTTTAPQLSASTLTSRSAELAKPTELKRSQIAERYGQLPLAFEQNRGQTDSQVKFLARGPGYSLFLTPTEAVFSLAKGQATNSTKRKQALQTTVLRAKLVNANTEAAVSGEEKLPGVSNYLSSNNQGKDITGISQYGRIRYTGIYTGIDLVYYGNQRELEYDFVVAPGADFKKIRLSYTGADQLSLTSQGDLMIATSGGVLKQRKPVIYQTVNGERKIIDGSFILNAGQEVAFNVGSFDASLPLTIDPQLGYSTYLGGTGHDSGTGIAVDSSGNAYVVGTTSSSDFPYAKNPPAQSNSAYVAKLNAAGTTFIYSSYIKGASSALAVAVDGNGSAYIMGHSYNNSFPVTPGAYKTTMANAFSGTTYVAKLSPNGSSLIYGTYFGGRIDPDPAAFALGADGSVYLAGYSYTSSGDFVVTPGALQTTANGPTPNYVARLNPQGSALLYSTYFGGSSNAFIFALAVDRVGNAYVSGAVNTPQNFHPTAGALQSTTTKSRPEFIAKLNPTGSALVYASFFPVDTEDAYPSKLAVDAQNNLYIAGNTYSDTAPVSPGAFQTSRNGSMDVFIAKVNSAASSLTYLTYLGGRGMDIVKAIAIDPSGNAYVAGQTLSTNFPTTAGAPQTNFSGGYSDAFITKLAPAGSTLVYSTYLGGSLGGDNFFSGPTGTDFATAVALDSCGSAYVTGQTNSYNFPVTINPPQLVLGNNPLALLLLNPPGDAFITKILSSTGVLPNIGIGTLPIIIGGANFGVKC